MGLKCKYSVSPRRRYDPHYQTRIIGWNTLEGKTIAQFPQLYSLNCDIALTRYANPLLHQWRSCDEASPYKVWFGRDWKPRTLLWIKFCCSTKRLPHRFDRNFPCHQRLHYLPTGIKGEHEILTSVASHWDCLWCRRSAFALLIAGSTIDYQKGISPVYLWRISYLIAKENDTSVTDWAISGQWKSIYIKH